MGNFRKRHFIKQQKKTLLQHGYEGFTFRSVPEQLDIARGTLYKYYGNKEALITEYMVYEMEKFLLTLQQFKAYDSFLRQLIF
ncbi:TetR/AcrR family transcriptional regulator [Oceanobacillus halotolerans]|uniref:TetR/AcrR family transcriptional regulator n=1 Tax=Oceanobacillus halotolerans TaxID=2663380 RepID=UPI0013DA0465